MPETMTAYVTACPVGCDAPPAPTPIALREGKLRRCPQCGQLMSAIAEAAYWASMQQFNQLGFNVIGASEDARRLEVAARRLARISQLLARPAQDTAVLDVGCSRGAFLAAGAKLGYRMTGVEPAANVAQAALDAGLDVRIGLLEDVGFAAASFDAITLFEVIEHLRDPRSLLRECARILKPGGILLLSTGNTASWTASVMRERWDYYDIAKDGGHISFYNPASIVLLAQRCGLQTALIETSRVKFFEKGHVGGLLYVAAKIVAELLNLPARAVRRGHDMLAYLRVPASARK